MVPPIEQSLGSLTFGELKEDIAKTISANAGQTDIKVTEGNLAGFNLKIPANTFAQSNTLKISSAKVIGHKYDVNLKTLTPLIQIEAENGQIQNGITISIPINLPANHHATAFAVADDGALHILPMLSLDKNSIQIMLFDLNYQKALTKSLRTSDVKSYGQIIKLIVFAIDEEKLTSVSSMSTFTPGVDDWEFQNYGSSYSPEGNCFGMTVSSLFYHLFKKKNSGKLFGRSDLGLLVDPAGQQLNSFAKLPLTKDALWFDNSLGIKLVSVVQEKQMSNVVRKIRVNYEEVVSQNIKVVRDRHMYNFISSHLLVSNEPLLLGCYGNNGGHAVLVIGKKEDRIIIADPNTIGMPREILYNRLTGFDKYASQLRADAAEGGFSDFYILPVRSVVNFEDIETAWNDLASGTVGQDVLPDMSYKVVQNGTNTPLSRIGTNKIKEEFEIISSADSMNIFTVDGIEIKPGSKRKYKLGTNTKKIGVLAQDRSINQSNGKAAYRWADFKWFDVEVTTSIPADTVITNPKELIKGFGITIQGFPENTVFTLSGNGEIITKKYTAGGYGMHELVVGLSEGEYTLSADKEGQRIGAGPGYENLFVVKSVVTIDRGSYKFDKYSLQYYYFSFIPGFENWYWGGNYTPGASLRIDRPAKLKVIKDI